MSRPDTASAPPKQLTNKPLAISIGDPAGIGPEIIAKAWLSRHQRALPPFYVLGPVAALSPYLSKDIAPIETPGQTMETFDRALPVIDIPLSQPAVPGIPNPANAGVITGAIETAVEHVLKGATAALVTAPIHKAGLYDTGFGFRGHTDYLAHLCGQSEDDAVMLLAGPDLRVAPLTIHIPLKDVPAAITRGSIIHTATIMLQDLRTRFGFENPRLAIAGLNPHAGEDGGMGREEQDIIAPAIAELQAAGHQVSGPHPADTLFTETARMGYDAALAMYHDQALIPVKALDFRAGVNATLGLKIVRTSPDHGTAFDIAGQDMADPESMIQAILLAARLAGPQDKASDHG